MDYFNGPPPPSSHHVQLQMPMPSSGYSPHSPSGYGFAKQQLMRARSVKHVELQQGNLVLDCAVPASILSYAKDYSGNPDEFKKMRYTACTSDPDDFARSKYALRQHLWKRQIEMAVVMTCYNEDEVLFDNTMTSVVKNIQHLQSRSKSKTWGKDAWKKVLVVIVADGRAKIHPKMLKMLGLMGVYQEGIAKNEVAGRDVQAHIFEYSTQVVVDSMGNVSGGIAPVQICFILKEQNKKKLNSHRWFFNAVCQQLNPNVCILLDVGTKPSGTSIYKLWKDFDKHSNIGGACGEIVVDPGRGCSNILNPLVAAQNFEYKMANILDKPTESVFGYISVLPGAFSAYRWKALQNHSNGKGPLASYFLGEKMHEEGHTGGSAFDANMYLAEDRILCFEIVTKKKEAWVLHYNKGAKATTDAPNNVAEYIGQRRRWLNGSFFAALYATLNFWRIWTSGHNIFRCLWLTLEFIYNAINMLFQFIALANFYLAFFFLCQSSVQDPDNDPFGGSGQSVVDIVTNVYVALMFVILICSMGNRPKGAKFAYMACILFFAALFGIALYCAGFTIWLAIPKTLAGWQDWKRLLGQPVFRDIVISLGATYGLYIYSSLIHLEPWHLLTSFVQYMFFLPASINILGIYSFANLHDVSWGTKESGPAKDLGGAKQGKEGKVEVELPTSEKDVDQVWMAMRKDLSVKSVEAHEKRSPGQKQQDHMMNFRTNVVLAYLGTNMLIVLFFTSRFFLNWVRGVTGERGNANVNPYMRFIFYSVAGLALFRAFGTTFYMILRLVFWK